MRVKPKLSARFGLKLQTIQTKTSLTAPALPWDVGHKYLARLDLSVEDNKNGNKIMGLGKSPFVASLDAFPVIPGIAHGGDARFVAAALCGGHLTGNFAVISYGSFPNMAAIR